MGGKKKGVGVGDLLNLYKKTVNELKEGNHAIITEFKVNFRKVNGQLQALKDLSKNVDLPKDQEAQIKKIKKNMKGMHQFVKKNYGVKDDGTIKMSWKHYVPIIKPFITTLAPAACFYMSRDSLLPFYVLGMLLFAAVVYFIDTKLEIHFLREFIKAWRGAHDAQVDKYCRDLRKYYDKLRDFASLQIQLQRARTFDVRSILEDNKKARMFWIRNFGPSKASVETLQMVEALLHHNKQTHMVGKQKIELVYNTISLIIDKNNDGNVSPIELLDFLKYFGPIDKCVSRIKESLIDDDKNHPSRYPWFIWRKKDRQELVASMMNYGLKGDFIVRCASIGGFAVTHLIHDPQGRRPDECIKHVSVPYNAESDKPFSAVVKEGGVGRLKHFKSLSDLVYALREKLKQPFMDPETMVYFSISGTRYQVEASLFMVRTRRNTKTYLGELFNPSPLANGFPEGAFWGSEEGHTFENPIFFDTDPGIFNVILNWYRYGDLYIPKGVSMILAREEIIEKFKLPFTCKVTGARTLEFVEIPTNKKGS